MSGGIIGLIGLQGVGKSSALTCIFLEQLELEAEEWVRKHDDAPMGHDHVRDTIRFKWRREPELFRSLIERTHEASDEYLTAYKKRLIEHLKASHKLQVSPELAANPRLLNLRFADKKLGKTTTKQLARIVWIEILMGKETILIDTPDYSKTDMRMMAKDIEGIHWLWHELTSLRPNGPTIIVAIQKEMFRDHFFFDKMQKSELHPLGSALMLEAYRRRFGTTDPFTEDALLTLARMSRGIFRHFLRYLTLTLDLWKAESNKPDKIDAALVKNAVTSERLAEDMDLELSRIFPRDPEARMHASRILRLIQESGPQTQSKLAKQLGLKSYTVSRLLEKLEYFGEVTRRRSGTDKIVSLRGEQSFEPSASALGQPNSDEKNLWGESGNVRNVTSKTLLDSKGPISSWDP